MFLDCGRKFGSIFLAICACLFTQGHACESNDGSNLVSDEAGNAYLLWQGIDQIAKVNIKAASSSTWGSSATISPNQAFHPTIAAADDGVVVAWIEEITYPSYGIYISMYSGGSWTTPFLLTDPTESIMNSFDLNVTNNPVSTDIEVNIAWLSYYNEEIVMRTNTGIFGSNTDWSGPTNLPS